MSAVGNAKPGSGRLVVLGGVAGDPSDRDESEFTDHVRRSGFEVMDLGAEVSAARFAGVVREHRPVAIVLSCYEVVCARGVGLVIEELERQRLRDTTRILLRGTAFNREFACEVGADGFASDVSAGAGIISNWIDS